MRSLCKILAVFTVSCALTYGQTSEHQNFRKEWKFTENAIFKFGDSIASEDNSFLYAVCSDEKLPAEMSCKVRIETPIQPWNESKSHRRVCDLKLIGGREGELRNEVTRIASIERFGRDRAIVSWWERPENSQYQVQNIRIGILSMTDCSLIDLTFPIDVQINALLSNVVIYRDTFDVVISNRAICSNSSTCRLSYDANGQRIGDRLPFITNLATAHIRPVASNSSTKGFYVSGADMGFWKFRAMHVSPDGAKTNFMTVSVSDPREVYHASSSAYELYGICLMGDRRLHCAQFDEAADVKFNATLRIAPSVQWMAVHNMAGGGILVLTGHCNKNKCRGFRVTRVRADGPRETALELTGLQLKCSNVPREFTVNVVESEVDFCFYFACAYVEEKAKSSVKFSSKCVPKSEFKL